MTRRCLLLFSLTAICALAAAGTAFAATADYAFTGTPGSATLVSPGYKSATAAQLTSTDDGGVYTWSAVNLLVLPHNFVLKQLNNLSTYYEFTTGSCWGGAPRFEVWVPDGSGGHYKIFFYLGPPPTYTGCPFDVWLNSGNLVTNTTMVDDSQLPGGAAWEEPWSTVKAKFGNLSVIQIYLDDDGGWKGDQTIEADNTRVNGSVVTYEK